MWYFLSIGTTTGKHLGGLYVPAETELEALIAASLCVPLGAAAEWCIGPLDECLLDELVPPERRHLLLTEGS